MKTSMIWMILILTTFVGFSQRDLFAQQLPSINPSNVSTINGSDIEIHYDVTGGKLLSINADSQSKSLTIMLQPISDGKLTVKLPRTLIDAQLNGADTHFMVYRDGHGTNYDEIESFRYRILSVPFHSDSEKITITGTQISLNANQSQNTNSYYNKKQVTITAPFTRNPPIIDGKWTTNEWDTTTAVTVEQNGTKMYVIAEHDQNFIYVMSDIVTDQTTPSNAYLVQIGTLMIFDTDNYTGDSLSGKDIGIGTGKYFVNGTEIRHGFGSEVQTYDEQGKSIDLAAPQGYNSSMSLSSTNDPFDSVHPHRVYEFKIPKSLVHTADKYGFSLIAYTCLGKEVNLCRANNIFWPSNTILSIPATHGLLELTSESNHSQSFEFVPLSSMEIIVIVAVIVSIVVIYFVKIKNRES
ncbi:MAG: hypothetical protein KGH81_06470 [Thaumarchaeota archaeon]|nr:hypothetical protein [Nitrososphaerota archaeon]MDE1841410.1 hypothetical protein [Nitrososphaerota archaeon]